jgi:hypothetical protein
MGRVLMKLESAIKNAGVNMLDELGEEDMPSSPYCDMLKLLREARELITFQDEKIADLTYQNNKLAEKNEQLHETYITTRDALVAANLEKYCGERGSV